MESLVIDEGPGGVAPADTGSRAGVRRRRSSHRGGTQRRHEAMSQRGGGRTGRPPRKCAVVCCRTADLIVGPVASTCDSCGESPPPSPAGAERG